MFDILNRRSIRMGGNIVSIKTVWIPSGSYNFFTYQALTSIHHYHLRLKIPVQTMAASSTRLLAVSIESQQFPGSYLRIDGNGVTKRVDGGGGGTVNAQNYVGSYETLIIVNDPGTNTFSILSSVFQNVYLRMDGQNVKSGQKYPSGAGTVNCQ